MRRLGWIFAMTAAVTFALTAFSQRANADDIDWGVPSVNTGASIAYAGGAAPLIGTNITVASVTDLATSVAAAITSGILDFTTGNLTGSDSTDWFFGAGPAGGMTIAGTVAACPALMPCTGTLLTGTIQSAKVEIVSGTTLTYLSVFINSINSNLLSFFGINFPLNTWSGTTTGIGFTLASAVTPPNGFTSTSVHSGDMLDTPVPEPASLLLLGTGLLGLAFLARKRFGKSPDTLV